MTMKGNNSHVTFTSAYAPTMAYLDQAKEEFYEQLDHAIQSVTHSDKLFLLGDFNARAGSDHTTSYKVFGHHGIGKENPNGTLLLTLCVGSSWSSPMGYSRRRLALRRLGHTHALIIGIKLIFSSSGKETGMMSNLLVLPKHQFVTLITLS